MPKPIYARDIPGFIKRPYPEQLAVMCGRVLALGAAVDELEGILGEYHLELGERFAEAGVREPITNFEQLVETVLALEDRITQMRGALQFIAVAMDSLDTQTDALDALAAERLEISSGGADQEAGNRESAGILGDLGLPPVEKRARGHARKGS